MYSYVEYNVTFLNTQTKLHAHIWLIVVVFLVFISIYLRWRMYAYGAYKYMDASAESTFIALVHSVL